MRILFVAARFPDPLLSGYQVRAFHQLRLLGQRHSISLVCYTSGSPNPAAYATVARFCQEIIPVPLQPLGRLRGLAGGLWTGRPFQAALFDTVALRRTLQDLLGQRRHDVVHLQLLRMAPALEGACPLPRVIDLVDALSLNMARRARLDRGPGRWAARLEAQRLRRYEAQICQTWEASTVVSENDRAAIGDYPRLSINPNGVDLQRFSLGQVPRTPNEIVFTGNLGYFPNVDGVTWFARECLPILQSRVPQAHLTVVGARPSAKVRSLQSASVQVQGFVPEMAPYLHRAQVAIAPLRGGSGQLFKILEAMACGTPVVATPTAASGTGARDGQHLLLAQSAEEFAQAIHRLLQQPELAARLATEARALVERDFPWDRSVDHLESLYETVRRTG